MKDFKEINKEIYYRLVNYEANREMLARYPHIKVLDLAALFYYRQKKGFKEEAPVFIGIKQLREWRLSAEELYELAKENTVKSLPPIFRTIEQIISDIAYEEDLAIACEEEPCDQMYVLTNKEKYFGAGCVLYPGVLRSIFEKLRSGFFVLPSSIHECIVMPDLGGVNAINLRSLVAEMNQQFLETEEVLSNQVYRYDYEKDELILA